MDVLADIERAIGPIPKAPIIGGEVVAGAEVISVVDPATEKTITEIGAGDVATGVRAVDAAADALRAWTETSPRRRSDVLRRTYDLMHERAEALAQLIVLENGKSLTDARAEVSYAAEFFRWYSEEAVRLSGTVATAPSGTNNILVLRQPIGVSLLITPWNFPAAMATRKIGPALAAGCSVVLKPASETPLTALAIAGILTEAGVPDGVVNVVPSRQSGPLASHLLDDDRVRKVSFTGSTEVGRTLLGHASRSIVSASMELGGNAPFVVLADADLDLAVSGAMVAKLRNGGSACTAANRFLVHESVAGEFASRFAAAMAGLTVGPGLDPGTDIGPLVNVKTRDKVAGLVQTALDDGATPVVGAEVPDRPGYYYAPTVLGDVAQDSAILGQEIFGPVAPVVPFADLDEAIALANATEFGLVSYVYTGDLARGLAVSERLDSGMVGLNRPVVSDPAAPFGGTKQSGLGREGGHEGMLEFTESKYIALDW
ncbi:NAD-dependent succinate-semialdehyde dehydrogenase [Saccharopolyspora phatthalungensis]|uniref:Succinate-semialdehyde dehydrogenase/glutarate-semialdehyde dehydrogenase n=1 Tax=Saccharopolyspora phatthalungensis TaxID=664693 RepID=A0A840Q3U8_9PSEU|nr:NAD-dependent succinate-semialdehyde dehydrogenase [Saccharopolyspora phatthalungensis]MBB5157182.1 succinate-semialdehyde dehydrogenase/glutarate-semialdehyde dehydrogenase [Saccharopolyspora phatthalungensis]